MDFSIGERKPRCLLSQPSRMGLHGRTFSLRPMEPEASLPLAQFKIIPNRPESCSLSMHPATKYMYIKTTAGNIVSQRDYDNK